MIFQSSEETPSGSPLLKTGTLYPLVSQEGAKNLSYWRLCTQPVFHADLSSINYSARTMEAEFKFKPLRNNTCVNKGSWETKEVGFIITHYPSSRGYSGGPEKKMKVAPVKKNEDTNWRLFNKKKELQDRIFFLIPSNFLAFKKV